MNLRTKIFKDLIEEQLASIPDITFRRLFSGFGIYSGEAIFGLIHGDKLYFHTEDESRTRYKKCGSTFFIAPGSKKPLKNYYEIPTLHHRTEERTCSLGTDGNRDKKVRCWPPTSQGKLQCDKFVLFQKMAAGETGSLWEHSQFLSV